MHLLKFTLIMCSIAGCWQPSSCNTSLFKNIIYKIYAIFMMSFLYTFMASQFMNIVLNVDNSDDFTDTLYMMLTILVAGYKQVYMWIDRKNIMVMINILNEKPFAPCESHEITIRQKFDKMIQNSTFRYLILVVVSIMSIILTSVSTELAKRNLTYKAWVPFDYSSPTLFFTVYIHQLISMSTSGIVNVACDSLICGFLLHICCQVEILEHRLTKITNGEDILSDSVRHHNRIYENYHDLSTKSRYYLRKECNRKERLSLRKDPKLIKEFVDENKYARRVNKTFTVIIAMQFAVSMLVVCSNLYRIAMAEDYMSYIPLMCYTNAILAQIFIYCWFGNEVKLKSLHLMNNIFNMEWPVLNNSNKKALLLIMRRAMIPIEFSSAHIITMNLDTFVALLKMSYSTFNLLRQTHE